MPFKFSKYRLKGFHSGYWNRTGFVRQLSWSSFCRYIVCCFWDSSSNSFCLVKISWKRLGVLSFFCFNCSVCHLLAQHALNRQFFFIASFAFFWTGFNTQYNFERDLTCDIASFERCVWTTLYNKQIMCLNTLSMLQLQQLQQLQRSCALTYDDLMG